MGSRETQVSPKIAFVVLPAGLLLAIWYGISRPLTSTAASIASPALPSLPAVVSQPDRQQVLAGMQQAKAEYDRGRDLVRKSHPKTEDDLVRLLGRKADQVIATGADTTLMWVYPSNVLPGQEHNDVMAFSIKDGKIVYMNL